MVGRAVVLRLWPQTGTIIIITWELVRRTQLRPTKSKSLGTQPSNLCFNSSPVFVRHGYIRQPAGQMYCIIWINAWYLQRTDQFWKIWPAHIQIFENISCIVMSLLCQGPRLPSRPRTVSGMYTKERDSFHRREAKSFLTLFSRMWVNTPPPNLVRSKAIRWPARIICH